MITSNTRFSQNWNGKLSGSSFTTIRLYDEKKYAVGTVHEIWFNDKQLGKARVVGMRKMMSSKMNEWIARLDTGYSLAETHRLFGRMYKNKRPANGELVFSWVLFEWTERYVKPMDAFFGMDIEIGGKKMTVPLVVWQHVHEIRNELNKLTAKLRVLTNDENTTPHV